MKTNWIIVGIVVFFGLILVVYLIKRNNKDEKNLTEFLNNKDHIEAKEAELNEDDDN